MDNIIGFLFNFHRQCDVELLNQSPSYIREKWNKYIGTKPKSVYDEISNVTISKWLKRWHVSNDEFLELKDILYLILLLNTKSLLVRYDGYPWNVWDLETLIDTFSSFVEIKDINNEYYCHSHHLIKMEISKWLDKPENRRTYNLNIILNNKNK